MPYQCDCNHVEFQEEKLNSSESRARLAEKARPRRCPYCGEHGTMAIHSWPRRFLVLGKDDYVILRVPVFRCGGCRRSIRVLPEDCESFAQHSSSIIREAVRSRLEAKRFISTSYPGSRLRRYWYESFRKRVEDTGWLLLKGLGEALEALPGFCILFHRSCRAIAEDDIRYRNPEDQRVFRHEVYQRTG